MPAAATCSSTTATSRSCAIPPFVNDSSSRLARNVPQAHKALTEGSWEAVAEVVFNTVPVDGFFLEYDSERSGGFEPLRFMPKSRNVVLGLISSKLAALEPKDAIKRRIDEATRYVDLDRLHLSPQCGFASTQEGNEISEDEQWRKLAHVVEIAREVWRA